MADPPPEDGAPRAGAPGPGSGEGGRDLTLDVLRGIAICLMVQDHVATALLGLRFPAWCELYAKAGSFVPALFVLLAGMGVAYTAIHRNYTLRHYLARAGFLTVTAAGVVDMAIWGLVPFVSAEILYLIALSLPLAFLFRRLGAPARWVAVLAIFALTPVLQHRFGYAPHPSEWSLSGVPAGPGRALNRFGILQHWFIDGWFPVFPWLGVALAGVNLGLMRWKSGAAATFAAPGMVAAGVLLFLAGLLLWKVSGTELIVRGGYREMIYPPTVAYLATSFGQILLLFSLVDWRPRLALYSPFLAAGESSLFLYWFHLGVVERFPFRPDLSGRIGTIFAACLVFFLCVAYLLRSVRKRFPGRSPALKYILGI